MPAAPIGSRARNAIVEECRVNRNFTAGKVVTYRIGPIHDEFMRPRAEIPTPANDEIECGGELSVTGHAFQVVAGNVP
jgi:hypothetical protein